MVTHTSLGQKDRSADSEVKYDHSFESHSYITPYDQRQNAWDQAQYDASHPKEFETQTQ